MGEEPVRLTTTGAVATVTLNRPDAANALDLATKELLLETLRAVAADPEVRAVVLTGAGRAFCAGQDLGEHAAALAAGRVAAADTVRRHFNPLALAVATMPKPVLAAVNGAAAGAGASLAFAADLRLAAAGAHFSLAFTRVGLAPDTGASWTLPRLVGTARAVELMLLAERMSAERALDLGLVTAVVADADLPAAAAELAARLAAGPTAAYAAVKAALLHSAGTDLAGALAREAELQDRCFATEDHRQATGAFLAKRSPVYTGR